MCVHCTCVLEWSLPPRHPAFPELWSLPPHHSAFPEQLSTLSPHQLQNPPAAVVCALLGCGSLSQGSNPACSQRSDPQILIPTFNLLFFIFTPPSHNMPLSYSPRNCLLLAVCSSMERGTRSYACGYQEAQRRTRLMEVACDLYVFMHMRITCKCLERGCFVSLGVTGMGQEYSTRCWPREMAPVELKISTASEKLITMVRRNSRM